MITSPVLRFKSPPSPKLSKPPKPSKSNSRKRSVLSSHPLGRAAQKRGAYPRRKGPARRRRRFPDALSNGGRKRSSDHAVRTGADGRTVRGQSGIPGRSWQPPELRGKLSVIVTARNEEETLQSVLKEAERLMPEEIIVVLNGCTDDSFPRARESGKALIVHLPDPAGHDVGRAIGARLSRGDIMLFLDGDMTIPAPALAPFAIAVDRGADVALNDLNPLLPAFGDSDGVTRCKMFLNLALGRKDLGAGSMTAVPHALSREAFDRIGAKRLAVPPLAQAAAILANLRVENAGTVNVIKHNRIRKGNTGTGNAMERLIIGDHAEALGEVFARRDPGTARDESGLEFRRRVAAWRNAR